MSARSRWAVSLLGATAPVLMAIMTAVADDDPYACGSTQWQSCVLAAVIGASVAAVVALTAANSDASRRVVTVSLFAEVGRGRDDSWVPARFQT